MKSGRVIFGELKRRKILIPNVITTRASTDFLKETLFNCLIHKFQIEFNQWTFIDLFAGSGAIGIEAISLGSQQVIFCDNNNMAINTIKNNLTNLKIEKYAYVLKINVKDLNFKLLQKHITNNKIMIYVDPPYDNFDLLQIKFPNNSFVIFETNNQQFINNLHAARNDTYIIQVKKTHYLAFCPDYSANN